METGLIIIALVFSFLSFIGVFILLIHEFKKKNITEIE